MCRPLDSPRPGPKTLNKRRQNKTIQYNNKDHTVLVDQASTVIDTFRPINVKHTDTTKSLASETNRNKYKQIQYK